MKTFVKQPAEIFDYDIDMVEWFDELDDSDQIASIAVTSVPAFAPSPGLELGPGALPDTQLLAAGPTGLNRIAKIWLGHGTDGVDYIVTAKITTDLGRLDESEFRMRVKELS